MRIYISIGIISLSLLQFKMTLASEQSFSFTTDDGKTLDGIITLPIGTPKALALILPGSGTNGTDGDVSGDIVGRGYKGGDTKLSDQLAVHLSAQGFASFRFNKRGFKDATPASKMILFSRIKMDAKEAALAIKQQFPELPFYMVGLSEGSLISMQLAPELNPVGIFLLSPPAGNIDDWFRYQSYEWPLQLLKAKVDLNHDGVLTSQEFKKVGLIHLPLLEVSLSSMGTDAVTFNSGIYSAYRANYVSHFLALEALPSVVDWYTELAQIKDASVYLMQYSGKTWIYNGALDAQIDYLASASLGASAKHLVESRIFSNLGHCFSLHDGVINEIKTAGPLDASFTTVFEEDLGAALIQ